MSPADTIFENGRIRTMATGAAPVADAVAVRDGRIIAVGGEAAQAVRGPRSRIFDLGGRTMLPGFQDAHAHPTAGGLSRMRCNLDESHDLDSYRQTIAAYARSHPDEEWIRGAGWYGDVFDGGFPDASILDEIEPHRPVVLDSHDGHGVWVNTAALVRAGIDSTTPDPAGGRIHRTAGGEPSGMLMESAADLVTDLLPSTSRHEVDRALLTAQQYLHSLGITAWQDAAVGDAIGIPDAFDAYRRLDAEGRLTAKVTGALWWDRDADAVAQIALLQERRRTAFTDGGHFQATAIKIMQDGVCENLTGSMLATYHGQGDDHGMSFIDPEELRDIAAQLAALRFDLHIHAVGDRAVREAVDAIATDPGGWDSRHQITHIDIVDWADAARMGALKVIANVQPLWARNDSVLVTTKLPYLTADQQARHFAFRALRDAGAPLALSSDWPVSSPDPMWGMHVAVNRTAPHEDPHAQDDTAQCSPLLPEQSLTIDDAVRGYTVGAARANRLDRTGTIETGKAADFAVLGADPYDVASAEIGSIRVALTVCDGEVVFER